MSYKIHYSNNPHAHCKFNPLDTSIKHIQSKTATPKYHKAWERIYGGAATNHSVKHKKPRKPTDPS